MKTSNRLIVGCGYLGMPTAKIWLERGDEVWAVSRDPDRFRSKVAECSWLKKIKLVPGDITDPNSLDQLSALPPFETVLFAVGMDRSQYQDIFSVYVEGLKNVIDRLHPQTGHFIYISSTGVFGNLSFVESSQPLTGASDVEAGIWVDETTEAVPDRDGGRACLQAESWLQSKPLAIRTSILRFAGIYGPQRVPLLNTILDQQWDRLSPEGYLNLIHVNDGASIIIHVADHPNRSFQQIILISDGHPVPRQMFYDYLAKRAGVGPIPWQEIRSSRGADAAATERAKTDNRRDPRTSHKKISNKKLRLLFSYKFQFPDYQTGIDQEV